MKPRPEEGQEFSVKANMVSCEAFDAMWKRMRFGLLTILLVCPLWGITGDGGIAAERPFLYTYHQGDVLRSTALLDAVPELAIVLTDRPLRAGATLLGRPQLVVPASVSAASDPLTVEQYAIERLNLREAWNKTTGARSIIALLDSGVDLSHPDLQGVSLQRLPAGPYDGSTGDACGHGTEMAGVIFSQHNNGLGIVGVAPNATLLPIRVIGQSGGCTGDTFQLAKGIVFATLAGADQISISLSAGAPGAPAAPELKAALEFANSRGVITVVAAGNTDGTQVRPPAAEATVLAAGCTDGSAKRCARSPASLSVDFALPGDDIWTTSGGSWVQRSGTSMSAAMLSGVVALGMSVMPNMTLKDAEAGLAYVAQPSGELGTGAGEPDAAGFVSWSAAQYGASR